VKSTVEELEGNKVKLTIEVDEGEFDKAVDAAFRKLGREVKVPGFRPGKVPRRLIEARLGSDVARQEALRDSLPDFYEKALKEHDVEPIAPPEIDITSGQQDGPVAFDAVVEVMPEVRVAGYEGLRVALPNLSVSDEEVEAQVDRLREQFGELRPVSRPARPGDHVSIDRRVYRHDETILTADDELYEVGAGTVAAELDDQLSGAKAGDILKFNAELPDTGEVSFQVLVKEVREKILPEVTDEWASEASEFETAAELRADIRTRADAVKRLQAALLVREKVIEALVELVDDDMPQALIAGETQRRAEMLVHRLGHQGVELGDYLDATGQTSDALFHELEEDAAQAIKADLALRYLADAEGIEVTDDDVSEEMVNLGRRQRISPEAMRQQVESEGRLSDVRSGIRKSKALEWLIEHTEYVDEDGRVVDRTELEPPKAEDDQRPDRSDPADTEPADSSDLEGQPHEQETE
jgi:trigger factor